MKYTIHTISKTDNHYDYRKLLKWCLDLFKNEYKFKLETDFSKYIKIVRFYNNCNLEQYINDNSNFNTIIIAFISLAKEC